MQDARLQARLIDYKNTVLTAQEEVENAIARALSFRVSKPEFLRRSVRATRGALNLAFDQYHEGLVDFTTVLTTEQNLLQAQTNLAASDRSGSFERRANLSGSGWRLGNRR